MGCKLIIDMHADSHRDARGRLESGAGGAALVDAAGASEAHGKLVMQGSLLVPAAVVTNLTSSGSSIWSDIRYIMLLMCC